MPFEVESFSDEKGLIDKAEKKELMYNIGKYVFYITIVLSILLFVVKPLINLLKAGGGSIPMRQVKNVKDVYVGGGGGASVSVPEGTPPAGITKAQPALGVP
jgi:hypothetical protein